MIASTAVAHAAELAPGVIEAKLAQQLSYLELKPF
jgi:hypothetical protein